MYYLLVVAGLQPCWLNGSPVYPLTQVHTGCRPLTVHAAPVPQWCVLQGLGAGAGAEYIYMILQVSFLYQHKWYKLGTLIMYFICHGGVYLQPIQKPFLWRLWIFCISLYLLAVTGKHPCWLYGSPTYPLTQAHTGCWPFTVHVAAVPQRRVLQGFCAGAGAKYIYMTQCGRKQHKSNVITFDLSCYLQHCEV